MLPTKGLLRCAVLFAVLFAALGNTNQQWVGPTADTGHAIVFKPSCDAQGKNCQKCLDLAGGSTDNGTPIDIWDCLGNTNQKWVYGQDLAIRYQANTSKCIDLAGSSTKNGNKLWLWDCNGGKQQQWKGGGVYQFESELDSTKCMDLGGGGTANGNKLEIWDCAGAPALPCTGSSSGLNAVSCAAWQDLAKATNIAGWFNCSGALLDPCSCKIGQQRVGQGGVICANGDITSIALARNNLKGTIPSSLGSLSKLGNGLDSVVYLSGNVLTGLVPPPAIQTVRRKWSLHAR
jgi:hypothetical protein